MGARQWELILRIPCNNHVIVTWKNVSIFSNYKPHKKKIINVTCVKVKALLSISNSQNIVADIGKEILIFKNKNQSCKI